MNNAFDQITNEILINGKKLAEIIETVKSTYLADKRPWVVGYSGGKDSTAVVEIINSCKIIDPQTKRKKKNIYCSKYSGGATGSCDLAERDTDRNKYRSTKRFFTNLNS